MWVEDNGIWKEHKMLWTEHEGLWKEVSGGGLTHPWVERAYFTQTPGTTGAATLTINNLKKGDLVVVTASNSSNVGYTLSLTATGFTNHLNNTASGHVGIFYKKIIDDMSSETVSLSSGNYKKLVGFVIKNASSLGEFRSTTTSGRIPSTTHVNFRPTSIVVGSLSRGIINTANSGFQSVGSGFFTNSPGSRGQVDVDVAASPTGDSGVTGSATAVEVQV